MDVLSWPKARVWLEQKIAQTQAQLEVFDGSDVALGRLQGRSKTLREMLNLPEAIEMLDAHDKEMSKRA